MATQYRMHTQVRTAHSRGRHLVALVLVPLTVFAAAYAVWSTLKQQCAALAATECLPVGSTELGGSDVALLATFLAAGLAAIVEVATN